MNMRLAGDDFMKTVCVSICLCDEGGRVLSGGAVHSEGPGRVLGAGGRSLQP